MVTENRSEQATEQDPGFQVDRRNLLKLTGAGAAALGALSLTSQTAFAQYAGTWDKTFPQSDLVDHRKVSYANRLGINLVADMYVPKNIDTARRHPALIVGHPYGGVKEQTAGLYAQTMAERGFITIAHDASYNGESSGQPHFISSPEAVVEDFSSGVDFLGQNTLVDRNRIGVIGVCASGGFSLAAAQIDPRLKAVATVSMYDMGGAKWAWNGQAMSAEARLETLTGIGEQRWAEAGGAEKRYFALPETLTEDTDAITREFFDYYRTPRGRHPRATTAMTVSGDPSYLHFRPFDHVDMISPRPILLVVGENAHSRFFSEQAFERAADPKELFIVPGAGHVDLYDKVELIPWDKLQAFFDQHLSA
ncbi:alpha/beta hydrolase [Mesorhizobium captivum]|uniref:alpha/beta hydrolase n=1 Tax=Mesorhizobium captivum TaxID=3072319 RepID=UPI002A24B3F1|nr:alpha/beta hydrolase [Mesorhizobium sp. VK23E]MDX8510425.1 alpha/beta hydrolase [Mesorhizobium sp. VK23E]